MTQLVPIRLEDGTEIYMEATDDVVAPAPFGPDTYGETTRTAKGLGMPNQAIQTHAAQSFKAIEGTIRTYTSYTMNAFKDMATANVEKVTLEFGLKVGGEAGVPYVTKGTAESNLKITVECSFN
ncbi:CU044_2847 family protein [Leptolyngbya sp. CCNP1308]|uniref:CU044_2847 family protein n=1 Tax=Leptolyngbya sp. CCNP1308 TaxID=3110255 RepID=UPI002B201519|nr:CU044_2847 family protein [Leptolyngbya sp. CCNP1308]MEA5449785.1 CU044_2847 family protein [Leptolyngbya sp. CCNP1308]